MALQIITAAIEQSKGQNEIVRIDAVEIAQAGLTMDAVCRELALECEDSTSYSIAQGGEAYEYWGSDVDGNDWRVHVEVAS